MADFNGFDKNRWTVYVDDRGQHMLMSPNGERLYDIVRTVTRDDASEPALCKVSFLVNLVSTKAEALEGYGVKTRQEE